MFKIKDYTKLSLGDQLRYMNDLCFKVVDYLTGYFIGSEVDVVAVLPIYHERRDRLKEIKVTYFLDDVLKEMVLLENVNFEVVYNG